MLNIVRSNLFQGYKFIDLFAGIGGFHLALRSMSAECVFASEIDKFCQKTYCLNHKMLPSGDIRDIDNKDIPAHDILCAGFPCQSFSISGCRKGFEDKRGNLFFEIVRVIAHHLPKIVILENVKNLVKHNQGYTFKTITQSLQKYNYYVYYKVLNASNFGLAQSRERVIIVAIREDINAKAYEFPENIDDTVVIEDILEESSRGKVISRDDIFFTKSITKHISKKTKPYQIGYVNKGGQGERIYHVKGKSITLSAYGGGVGSKTGLYLVHDKVRKLSVREAARLQGFPDNFIFPVSDSQAYKQLGNAVPVNLIQSVLIKIGELLGE